MKRLQGLLLALAICLTQVPTASAVGTNALSAILVEASSGRVLYEQNAERRLPIASITKLMTALVALESGKGMEDVVEVEEQHTLAEGSSLYLKAGERLTLGTLLYGLLLQSGNDAAAVIAQYCGEDEASFVEAMNRKAEELGMMDTHFSNPSGLPDPEHYSTARDMALLARACLEREELKEITSTRSITLEGRTFVNHNKLLWRCQGCIGMKTGYTQEAGRTLISAADRDGMTLVAVTLNDPDDWKDHEDLYDYGFSTYSMATAARAGETLACVPTRGSLLPVSPAGAGEDLRYPVAEGEELTISLSLDEPLAQAPVAAGERAGEVRILLDGQEVASAPLEWTAPLPDHTAPARGLLERLRDLLPIG